MRLPLSRQILLPMVAVMLLTVGAVSALNAWLASGRVRREILAKLADVRQTLSAGNFPLESSVLRQTRGLTGAEYVVMTPAGRALAASDDSLLELAEDKGPAPRELDLSHLVGWKDRGYFHAVVALDRRAVGGGQLALHVFYPESAWREARWQATWPPLAIGGLAIVLVAAAAYLVARQVTLPIQRLRTQVERIAQGDFQPVPAPRRDDEVRDLIAAVNQMAQKLAQYEGETRKNERLRTLGTLGGGIAHQIRNAATGCRIALDLHQRDCPLDAANGDGEQPLCVAVRQLELIETHIQRFLTLGRPAPTSREPVELGEIVRQAVALVQPMARHVGGAIVAELPEQPLVVPADGESLVQMLVNLLMNAVQATAQARALAGGAAEDSRSAVVVRLEPAGDAVRIAVGDSGSGPAAAIRERLFEPFATDKPGGTGLGLVVARRVVEDHGGTIDWHRRDERTWFVATLPLHELPLDEAS